MTIQIIIGDITDRQDDAIVNAANSSLLAGSGVCGAIHKVAGTELEIACKQIGGCATGKAVITPGFNLKAKHVIHAVGPRWSDGTRGEPALLEECYHSIFTVMRECGLETISLPAIGIGIGIGIYRYPLVAATEIVVRVAKEYDSTERMITLVCFNEELKCAYKDALTEVSVSRLSPL
jgi:O-acetyl-ADP-ribose deacetylase (regulator of RNase III)